MIQPEELRVGNILKEGVVHTIGYSLGSHGYLGCHMLENIYSSGPSKFYKVGDLNPKKITQQSLEEIGFKKVDLTMVRDDIVLDSSARIVYSDELRGFSYEVVKDKFYVRVEFFHELQNLHFSLKGEEL